VWETDDQNSGTQTKEEETEQNRQEPVQKRDTRESRIQLDWKDWIALALAALQTILLPFVIIIVLLLALAVVFAH
jgi:hypothetical protein